MLLHTYHDFKTDTCSKNKFLRQTDSVKRKSFICNCVSVVARFDVMLIHVRKTYSKIICCKGPTTLTHMPLATSEETTPKTFLFHNKYCKSAIIYNYHITVYTITVYIYCSIGSGRVQLLLSLPLTV